VFTSERDGNSEIYTMRPDGSRQTRITNSAAQDYFPSFTTDGRHIVWESGRSGNQDVWIMDSDGGSPRQLIKDPAPDHIPEWIAPA
jgi:TolB protein